MNILSSIDFKNIEASLDVILPVILNNYCIIVNSVEYSFAEIEFYFRDENIHNDKSVFKRTTKSGDLFFHRYGVDISFQSNQTVYGGNLIRSLFKGDLPINGPVKCKLELLNNILKTDDSFNLNILFKEISDRNRKIFKCRREVGKSTSCDFYEKEYRYLADYERFDPKYKKNKFDKKIQLTELGFK